MRVGTCAKGNETWLLVAVVIAFLFLWTSGSCAFHRSAPPSDAGRAASGQGLIRVLASDRCRVPVKRNTFVWLKITGSALDCLPVTGDYDFLRHEYGDQLPEGAPAERDEVLHLPGKWTLRLCAISQTSAAVRVFSWKLCGFDCGSFHAVIVSEQWVGCFLPASPTDSSHTHSVIMSENWTKQD